MSITPIPLSSLKRDKLNSQVNSFPYQLYECSYILRLKPFIKEVNQNLHRQSQGNVDVYLSCFHESVEQFILVLVCSNRTLLILCKEKDTQIKTKQLNWFKHPDKEINSICIDPSRGTWVLCACKDTSLFLVPVLSLIKETVKIINPTPSWSQTDLSKVRYAKPLKGSITCVTWWHTLDDRQIGIVGTKAGELIFLDLCLHQEVCRSGINHKIINLKLSQDFNDRTTYLYIYTTKKGTFQVLLEQPSPNADFTSPSSLTQAFDMGYDMVSDCHIESILITDRNENKDDLQIQNRMETLSNDFRYSIHQVKYQKWIAKHEYKGNALEVFSDLKHLPEYVYHVPDCCSNILLSDNFIMTSLKEGRKVSLVILSRMFSVTSFGRQGLKKPDPSRKAEFQTFELPEGEKLIEYYKTVFKQPKSWNDDFPYNAGYEDITELASFLIVTEDGVLECRPKISPENYFVELAMKTDIEVAERLGLTLDLNIPLLCEFIGDKVIKDKEISTAIKYYNLSKCSPTKRATQLIEYSTVTESLIYIKQVLKKEINSLTSKEKKILADMAMLCYIEQVMESQKTGTFVKNLCESFKAFISDNFDYNHETAMSFLASNGLVDYLFDIAKARGLIQEALSLLASHGLFHIPQSVQNMLLDREFASVVCKASDGIFIKHMLPEEATKFLLARADITKQSITTLSNLLPKLEEVTLLQIARVFDPSRQFVKPYLEKSDNIKRVASSITVDTSSSEETSYPSSTSIITLFLKTLIILNARRTVQHLPDMKLLSSHISGQMSWSGSISKGAESMGTNEMLRSEVAHVQLACGNQHIAYITSDRELYTWGSANDGRLGHGDLVEERGCAHPMRVESLHMHGIQVLSVACGLMHTIALCQEGVYSWGGNKYGQLGIGDYRNRSRPFLLPDISSQLINSVACGNYHSLAITIDHKVYSWGWGVHGQLGLGSTESEPNPQQITSLKEHRIIQAVAGYAHSAVLTSKGVIYTFGGGVYGQLGIGTSVKKTSPQLVQTLTNESIYLIASGSFEIMAVSGEQTIYCWGRNYHQFHICGKAENSRFGRQMACNTNDISHRYLPEELHFKLQQPIIQLVCGNWHYMALTATNYIYTWGYNDCGQLGHYNKIDQPAPRLVKALFRRSIHGIAAGSEFSVAVDGDDQVLGWGRADGGLIGVENEAPVNTNPVARRTILSVLAPTPVAGLPIHFDQVSIGSGQSFNRDLVFDQNFDLPDLSSLGQETAPYSSEAILFSLFKLTGLYKPCVITQYATQLQQWFVLSFCFELREKWDKAYTYRMKAIHEYYKLKSKNIDHRSYSDRVYFIVSGLFKKFEDILTEDIEEESSLVEMILCVLLIFEQWVNENLSFRRLEDIMRKHIEALSPLFAIVFFGFISQPFNIKIPVLRFALYHVTKQHPATKHFSNIFYNELLAQIICHMDSGTNWYSFMSEAINKNLSEPEENITVPIEDSTLSKEEMLKEIITYKQKLLNVKSFITLSNAVATTLAAASIAQRLEDQTENFSSRERSNTAENIPDATVFTCSHNLPRYYMLEIVVPEFLSRMAELPQPLVQTAEVLSKFYKQHDLRIPMACPCCVYNQLRNEQLHTLRESGIEILNNRSSEWS